MITDVEAAESVQWSAMFPHSEKVPGSDPGQVQDMAIEEAFKLKNTVFAPHQLIKVNHILLMIHQSSLIFCSGVFAYKCEVNMRVNMTCCFVYMYTRLCKCTSVCCHMHVPE